jgi:Zn-dependent protease
MNEPVIPRCSSCASELGPRQLACPSCGVLVHRAKLSALAAEAKQAEAEATAAKATGERRAAARARKRAVGIWQQALALLPAQSKQHEQIAAHAESLREGLEGLSPLASTPSAAAEPAADSAATSGADSAADSALRGNADDRVLVNAAGRGPQTPQRKGLWGKLGGAALAVGLLLWKLKFVFAFMLSKGKVLLLGLTKGSTFLSMALAFGVYWAVFGWPFALGLVLSIYVHEMGHVIALRRYGIAAGAPMFIPGLGAFVRLRQRITDPRVDARVGLAGPLGGLAAALVALGLANAGGWTVALAIAKVGGWINLFNLLPIWQLDGGRAFNALTRAQRGWALAGITAAWFLSGDGVLLLLLIAAAVRIAGQSAEQRDRGALWLYLALVAAHAFLASLPVPGLGPRRR